MFIEEQYIQVFDQSSAAGEAAGKDVEQKIVELQKLKDDIRIIFAAAPSQNDMLAYLTKSTEIDWSKITAFNMDEYLGLQAGAPQLFANYLQEHLFDKVAVKKVHLIDPSRGDMDEIARVESLINSGEIDIVCLGIGQNGHLAFNDPPYADFEDPKVIKEVELDYACRQQQVIDGCFLKLDDVPRSALTLTIPTLMRGNHLYCVVVGPHKSEAVKQALQGELSTEWPATILRQHPNCHFYFDKAAYSDVM